MQVNTAGCDTSHQPKYSEFSQEFSQTKLRSKELEDPSPSPALTRLEAGECQCLSFLMNLVFFQIQIGLHSNSILHLKSTASDVKYNWTVFSYTN